MILTGGDGAPIDVFRRRRRQLPVNGGGGVQWRGVKCKLWAEFFHVHHIMHVINIINIESNAISLTVYLMHCNQLLDQSIRIFKVRTTP